MKSSICFSDRLWEVFFAGAMDILKYLIKPTGSIFPGFTLIAMLAGLIYGSFYYKKELSFWRVLAAHITVALVCNVLLNTWCLSILYGKGICSASSGQTGKECDHVSH